MTNVPSAAESNAVGRMMRPLSAPICTILFGASAPRATVYTACARRSKIVYSPDGEIWHALISSNAAAM